MNLENELTNVVIDDPEFAGDEQRKFVFAGSGSPAPDLNLARESAQERKFLAMSDRTGVLQFLEEREADILAEATKGMNRKQRRTFLSQYRKNKKNDHLRKA